LIVTPFYAAQDVLMQMRLVGPSPH